MIASGDEDAIAGFRDAHVEMVRAYCEVACRPERTNEACEAAFVDFLGRVLGAPQTDRDLEALLLRATRSAATARFQVPESAPPARSDQCAAVPELLAARANGELPDNHVLVTHVKHCARCQASAAQLQRADAAFGKARGWEDPATPTEPRPSESSPPAPRTVVRARRGGLIGRARKLRDQLGGDPTA